MSLKYRDALGVETPISGLNGSSGELIPSASYVQSGEITVPQKSSGDTYEATVTFSTPMPDTTYIVNLTPMTTSVIHAVVTSRTVNGFSVQCRFINTSQASHRILWTAFKLITNEDRALDEQAIADLQAVVPSDATNANKLVTSNGLGDTKTQVLYGSEASAVLTATGWYKIATLPWWSRGTSCNLLLGKSYNNSYSASHTINLSYGWQNCSISDTASDDINAFDKIRVTWDSNDVVRVFVHYNQNIENSCYAKLIATSSPSEYPTIKSKAENFVATNVSTYTNYKEFNLGTNGLYANGIKVSTDTYSTSETLTNKVWIDGKPIYRKVVDIGALPNATNKLVNHNITNLDRAVSIYGQAQSSTGNLHPLPYSSPTASQNIELYAGTIDVVIVTGSDRSNLTGYIILEYTKTTD